MVAFEGVADIHLVQSTKFHFENVSSHFES